MMRCPKRKAIGRSAGCGSSWLAVRVRRANYSAFNGYRYTPSDYSEIVCLDCGRHWRSKAKGVAKLPDLTAEGQKRLDEVLVVRR